MPLSLPHALRERAANSGALPALWRKQGDGPYRPWTWREVESQASRFARGLRALGLPPGRPLAVVCAHRAEWLALEAGAMAAGHPPAPCFEGWRDEDLAQVLQRLGPAAIVVDTAARLERVAALVPSQRPLFVVLDAPAPSGLPEGARGWSEVLALGEAQPVAEWGGLLEALSPDAVAAVSLTPGTEGAPRILRHTHAAVAAHARRFAKATSLRADDTVLVRRSAAGSLDRAVWRLAAFTGAQVYVAPEGGSFGAHLREARPTFVHGAPEDWEALRRGVEDQLAAEPPNRQKVYAWGRKAAQESRGFDDDYLPVPGVTLAKHKLAQTLVFHPLHLTLGVHAARVLLCGLGPARRETLEFFASVDLPVQEVWGTAEAGGPVSLNLPGSRRLGTQGRPLPGVAVRLPPDGEIQLQSDTLCLREDAAVDRHGWWRTGDVGDLDVDGFLRVAGRRQERLTLRGRRRTPPEVIEARLRTMPLVAHAVVVAAGAEPVALLSLDRALSTRFARDAGVPDDPRVLAVHPGVLAALEAQLDAVQHDAPDPERVRRFAVVPDGFSQADGELTPTGSVRRRTVLERRQGLLAPMLERGRKAKRS